MEPTPDGVIPAFTLSIKVTPKPLEPGKMDYSVDMPDDLARAWTLWKKLGDIIFMAAANLGDQQERKVLTMDEMGIRPSSGPRRHRG